MSRTTVRLTGLAAGLLTGALVLAGCSGGHTAVGSSAPSASAGTSPAAASAMHNAADVAFATAMRPHHEGAIAMAALAADRAADPRVKDLAARIKAAQQPEIDTLTRWLAAWGATPNGASASASDGTGDMGGMDHSGMDDGSASASAGATATSSGDMAGMSGRDMAALSAATGTAFDRLFLQLMSAHHRSAVQMAETEIADGTNPDAIAMAKAIRDTQNAEITEMGQLLTELGG